MRRENIYKALVCTSAVIGFFLLVEMFCRMSGLSGFVDADYKFYINKIDNDLELDFIMEDALLMWRLRPGYRGDYIKINSMGLRDKEYSLKKGKDVFRILCLGDSSTFGMWVPQSHTYHAMLEDKLYDERGSRGLKYEVINMGVPGYSSLQALNCFRYRGFKYDPDIVVLYIGINDTARRFHLSDKDVMADDKPIIYRKISNSLSMHSSFYRVMRKIILSFIDKDDNKKDAPVNRVSLHDLLDNISALNALCGKRKIPLILVLPPICENKGPVRDLMRARNIYLYREKIKEFCQDKEMPLMLLEGMLGKDSESFSPSFFVDPVHPNRKGHAVIMRELYEYLTDNKLVGDY